MAEEDNLIVQINNGNPDDFDFESKEKNIFSHCNFRLGFIRKVYGILSFQLAITVIFCFMSCTLPNFAKFQQNQPWLLGITSLLSIVLSITLFCFKNIGRTIPVNYIFCLAFTLCESYMVSCVCALYEPRTVLMAAFMTLGVTLALTVYACRTKTDLTIFGGILYILAVGLLFLTIFALFLQIELIQSLIAFVTVIFYGIYLIYDTQLIVGSGRYSLSFDDYILGSIAIYLDVIIIFLKLLKFFGKSKK